MTPRDAGLTFEVPVDTQGGDNAREHHMARHRRQQKEIKAVGLVCAAYRPAEGCSLGELLRAMAAKGPLDVRVVRLYTGTRPADPQNLGSKLKGIIDGLAKVFEIDDGKTRQIAYIQDQERAKVDGVRVEVAARAKVLPWPRWTAEDWREVAECLKIGGPIRWGPWCAANARRCAQQVLDAEAMAAALEKQ